MNDWTLPSLLDEFRSESACRAWLEVPTGREVRLCGHDRGRCLFQPGVQRMRLHRRPEPGRRRSPSTGSGLVTKTGVPQEAARRFLGRHPRSRPERSGPEGGRRFGV